MRSKRSHSGAPSGVPSTSRREFLHYGGAMMGAAIMATSLPRRAAAATQVTTFDYYISTTGSDSNPGTLASPWALTSMMAGNANNAKMAGKRIGFLPGTYQVATLTGVTTTYPSNFDYATAYLTCPAGTSSAPTYLGTSDASGNYSRGTAILDAQWPTVAPAGSSFTLLGSIVSATATAYITIDGFEIKNVFYHPIGIGAGTGGYFVVTSRSPGIVIQNVYIDNYYNNIGGQNSAGITLYACTGAVVQNCLITGSTDTAGRGSGMEVWNTDNSIIQYNTILATGSMSGGIFIKNQGNYNNTVRYNFVDLSASPVGSVSGGGFNHDSNGVAGTYLNVYNNIVIASRAYDSYLVSQGGFPNGLNTQNIYNNTFVGTPGADTTFVNRCGGPATINWYNNILWSSATSNRGLWCTNKSAQNVADYNYYHNVELMLEADGSSGLGTMYSSIAAWAAALNVAAIGKDAHTVTAATPGFALGTPTGATGTTPSQYKLAAGSPCAGTGSTNGQTSGTPCDMGAWGGASPPAQIGCSFAAGATSSPPVPNSPILSIS